MSSCSGSAPTVAPPLFLQRGSDCFRPRLEPVELTGPQEEHGVDGCVQRRLLVYSNLHVVDAPLEHQGAESQRLYLAGHQRVPAGEGEDLVRQVPGGVDTLGPVPVRDALQETGELSWESDSLSRTWTISRGLTDPGLGSGTLPVNSLHLESCTSMKGPSKTCCTWEKV